MRSSKKTSTKQLATVLSKLLSLSLLMITTFCCCDLHFAILKTFYDNKNMSPVVLGNSEGWLLLWAGFYWLRPSSLGWQLTNFAATPDKFRDKFAGAYNPQTLRDITESKLLPLSRNKFEQLSRSVICMFFHTIHLPLLITLHSTEYCKYKNNNKNISPCNTNQLRYL